MPRRATFLLAALLLAACQAAGPTGPAATTRPKAGRTAAPDAAPTAGATATPGPLATGGPRDGATPGPASTATPAPLQPAFLQKPASASTALSGTLTLDARYVVDARAGNLVGAGAGNLVGAGAGNLVGAGAGNLVGAGAGNAVVLGQDLVAGPGGQVLSHNGGAIIAAGAGNIIAAGAGNIVSAGAGNIVSAGAGNLRLLAEDGLERLAPGTALPAAGMQVTVRDLTTGALVPIGADADSKPVYAIYTNLKGEFTVFLPAGREDTVRLEMRAPDAAADPRLVYDTLVKAAATEAKVDDDVTLVHGFLAASWRKRVARLLVALAADPPRSDAEVVAALFPGALQGNADLLKALLPTLRQAVTDSGLRSAEALDAGAGRMADAVLATLDTGIEASREGGYADVVAEREKAFDIFTAAIAEVRDRAAAQMGEAEKAGTTAAFLATPEFQPGADTVKRPIDVASYLVKDTLSKEEDIQVRKLQGHLEALGFEKAAATRLLNRLYAANQSVGGSLGVRFVLAPDAALAALKRVP